MEKEIEEIYSKILSEIDEAFDKMLKKGKENKDNNNKK